jgi:hypothetical protein
MMDTDALLTFSSFANLNHDPELEAWGKDPNLKRKSTPPLSRQPANIHFLAFRRFA